MTNPERVDRAEILRHLALITSPGQVIEVRGRSRVRRSLPGHEGSCASIHRCKSLIFSLWRINEAVNGWPVGDATRPHRSGGA